MPLDPVSGSTRSWPVIGVCTAAASLSGRYIGEDATGWAYDPTAQQKYHDVINHGVGVLGSAQGQVGDVIGVALDLDAGTLQFYRNGVLQGAPGPAFTGLPTQTPVYAMIGTAGMYLSSHARFTGPFASAPPVGFAPFDAAP